MGSGEKERKVRVGRIISSKVLEIKGKVGRIISSKVSRKKE